MRLFIADSLCKQNEKNNALSYQNIYTILTNNMSGMYFAVLLLADLESKSLDYLYYR